MAPQGDRSTDGRQPSTARRPGGRTAERSARILAAAIRVLTDEGLPALTFLRIAEEAGVSRATMYRRWPTPAHLAVDAIRNLARDQIRIPDTGTLHEDLHTTLQRIGAFLDSPVGRASVAASVQLGANPSDQPDEPNPTWMSRWEDISPIFERAVRRRELPTGIDAEAMFAALAGALYFRIIVIGQPVTDHWIHRSLATTTAGYERCSGPGSG